MRHLFALCLVFASLGAGCQNAAVENMSAPAREPWDALSTFQGEPLMSIGYPLEMGNMGAVKSALKAPKFAEALAAFESAPTPSAHADKQALKDAAVKAWRDAIAAADGPGEELKALVTAAMEATRKL